MGGFFPAALTASKFAYDDEDLRKRADEAVGDGGLEGGVFSSLMKKAGDIRPTDPALGSYIDRYAQGKNVAEQPGFFPLVDVPMNAALATGYEGVKALPESIGNPILDAVGYSRQKSGQKTAPSSMSNVLGLISGMLSRR